MKQKKQQPERVAVVVERAFDAPYQGTTTYYQKGQEVIDPQEVAYLLRIKAPVVKRAE